MKQPAYRRTAALLVATLLTAGCAKDPAPEPPTSTTHPTNSDVATAAPCKTVPSPMADIATRSAAEPRMRIPTPNGWQQSTALNSELIRFAEGNPALRANDFTPNAVVTLEKAPGGQTDPARAFELEREALTRSVVTTNMQTNDEKVCGHPAQIVHYTSGTMGTLKPHPATVLLVAASVNGTTYIATVTIQTTDDTNPDYQRDSAEILTGFQMLSPNV